MRKLEQLEEEFSHLPWDDDPQGAVIEALILFSDIIRILYAPNSTPKSSTIGAIIRTIQALNLAVLKSNYKECEEIFSNLIDEIEYVGVDIKPPTISPEINKNILLDAIFRLQTLATD